MKKLLLTIIMTTLLSSAACAEPLNLADDLKSFLKSHYPWADIDVKDLRLSDNAPAGHPSLIVVEQSPPGKTAFTVKYSNGQKISVTAIVKASDYVVVSRRPLNKDMALRKEDVYTVLMDTARMPKGAVRNDMDILGKTLSRGVGMNIPITDVMVNESPQVKMGQKVVLVVEAPGFSIKATGELQQSGFVGNYVRVVNLVSHKVISGLLLDEHTVKVGL